MENSKEMFEHIPEQKSVSWGIAFNVSWANLRRRIWRSMITMLGVILAIAFLTFMLINNDIVASYVAADIDALNILLMKNGVDIYDAGSGDRMMYLLLSLSLLTCLVGIINSMLMSVTERIKEIGTLKCLGALDSFIVKTYFIESTLQGVIGTLIGLMLGLLVIFLINIISYGGYIFQLFPFVDFFRSVFIAFLIGTVISIMAAIGPAYWASSKEPVDAMREEE